MDWLQLFTNLTFSVASAVAVGYALWKVMSLILASHLETVKAQREQLPIIAEAVTKIKDAIADWPSDPERLCQAYVKDEAAVKRIIEAMKDAGISECRFDEIKLVVEQLKKR